MISNSKNHSTILNEIRIEKMIEIKILNTSKQQSTK